MKGKEISIEDAKKLPVGTKVWVVNSSYPNGELRQILEDTGHIYAQSLDYPRGGSCEVDNASMLNLEMKIYEWKDDVQMSKVTIIREEPKVMPIKKIEFEGISGQNFIIEQGGDLIGLEVIGKGYFAIDKTTIKEVIKALNEMLEGK